MVMTVILDHEDEKMLIASDNTHIFGHNLHRYILDSLHTWSVYPCTLETIVTYLPIIEGKT